MPQNTNTDIVLAGAFAAVSVDFLVYPLDTLKTRWQSVDYGRIYTSPSGRINRSMMFRGLYQGMGSVLLATIPSCTFASIARNSRESASPCRLTHHFQAGAFFTAYEGMKHALSHQTYWHPFPTPLVHAVASAIAESVSCAILTPAEVVKQNAQMVHRPMPGDRPSLVNIKGSSHPRDRRHARPQRRILDFTATRTALAQFKGKPWRLWRGYGTLLARNLPFTAIQFPMFERMRDMLVQRRSLKLARRGEPDRVSVLERGVVTSVSGGAAGSIAAVITTPIDVVKTRVMLQASGKGTSVWTVLKKILIRDKVKGLFRGGAIRAVWTFVGSGLYLGVYESGRFWLERRRKLDGADELAV